MEEIEVEAIEINGNDYIILDKINGYYYLSNENDIDDFVIFKEENDELVSIEDDEELDNAYKLYIDKYESE